MDDLTPRSGARDPRRSGGVARRAGAQGNSATCSAPDGPSDGPRGPRSNWTRDLALGSGLANAVGMGAVVGVVIWMDGTAELRARPGEVAAVVGAFPLTGVVFGALAGWLGQALLGRARDFWWVLLPLGFPVGAAVGLCEMGVALGTVLNLHPQPTWTLGAAAAAGGLVLGFGWPIYLVLDVMGKPGWAAIGAVAVLATLAVASILGVLLWTS